MSNHVVPSRARLALGLAMALLLGSLPAAAPPLSRPAGATTVDPGPPPSPCARSFAHDNGSWPRVVDWVGSDPTRPCYWDRMYQSGALFRLDGAPRVMTDGTTVVLTPEWAGPDPDYGYTTPPPDDMVKEGSFRLRFNRSPDFPYDTEPFLRSIDGRAALRTVGDDHVFAIPPTWDMSGCERSGQPYGWFVTQCSIRLVKGPYYANVPAGQPVPWMVFTGALFRAGMGDTQADIPMMTNCAGTCAPRYWGQARYVEMPVHIKPSPYPGFTATDLGNRTYRLDATGSLYNGTIDEYRWDFGDGTTEEGSVVEHTFARDGNYAVVLDVLADGQSGRATRNLAVRPPQQIDLAPIEVTDSTPAIGDRITATYRLQNTGATAISGAAVQVSFDPCCPVSSGSPRPSTVDLAPGASGVIEQDYWVNELPFTIAATARGTGSDGGAVVSQARQRRIGESSLRVDLTIDPSSVDLDPDGDGNFSDQPVSAHVDVSNTGSGDLEDIQVDLPQLTSSDTPAPVVIGTPLPDQSIARLEPGASQRVTFPLLAQHRGRTEVRAAATALGGSNAGTGDAATATVEVTGEQPVSFTWAMRSRYSKASDAATSRATADPSSFLIDVDFLVNDTCPTAVALTWTIDGTAATPAADPVVDCRVTFRRPNLQAFQLELEARSNGDLVGRATQDLEPRDIVVVSIGDSMSSGEGNPEPSGATWNHVPCHRSSQAGSAKAARLLEDDGNPDTTADAHSSVTFVHLACSGANMHEGLLLPFDGVTHTGMEAPQLLTIRTLLGDRDVDHVLLTIGINDVPFIGMIHSCYVVLNCFLDGSTYQGQPIREYLADRMVEIGRRYDEIAVAFDELGIPSDRIHLIEYPDAARSTDGSFCSYLGIDDYEMQQVGIHMTEPLNATGAAAASRHQWQRVGGVFSGFYGHGLCGPEPWMIGVGQSVWRQRDHVGAFHPNGRGHDLIAERIATQLRPDEGGTGQRVSWQYPVMATKLAKGSKAATLTKQLATGAKVVVGAGTPRTEVFTIANVTPVESTAEGGGVAEATTYRSTFTAAALYDHAATETVIAVDDLAPGLGRGRLWSSTGPNRFTGARMLAETELSGRMAIWYTPPATASVARVRFRVDGTTIRTDATAPFDMVGDAVTTVTGFDTTVLDDGYHTVTAIALGGDGRELERTTAEILVANTTATRTLRYAKVKSRSPSVALAGATIVSGAAHVFLGPSATKAITGLGPLQFVLDGVVLDTDAAAPYDVGDGGTATAGAALPSQARARGSHTIIARLKLPSGQYLEVDRATYRV